MKNLVYILISVIISLYSCDDPVQKIDWNTENIPQKLIVEGSITTDYGKHPITLKYSDDYFANKPARMVTNAVVTADNGNSVIQYIENPDHAGLYEAIVAFEGELNITYILNIQLENSIDGTNEYSATTKLFEGMRIDSISADLYNNPMVENEEDSLVIITIIYGLEPSAISNFYMIKLFRNGEILSDTVNSYVHFSDQEYGINGEEAIGFFINEEYEVGDTFGIELYSIQKEFENFLDGVNSIAVPGDPFGFSGPPANAVGNINNGQGLGFFYAAHITRGQAIVRDMSQ